MPARRWPPGLLRSENTAKGRQEPEARGTSAVAHCGREPRSPRGGGSEAASARGKLGPRGRGGPQPPSARPSRASPRSSESDSWLLSEKQPLQGVMRHLHVPVPPGAPCGARTCILTLKPKGSW